MKNKILILSVLIFLFGIPSWGFVENVTHGYANCTVCHLSPSGGGLLNDYGRSLSKELMSTWGWENSELPLFGALKNTERFRLGGDFRTIQTYLENAEVRQGRQFVMQKNIELGLNFQNVWLVGTLGTQEGPTGTPNQGDFLSERHYVLWDLTEEIKLRIGKFRLNYGFYDPNHTRVTKGPLGFGPGSESYIMEFSRFTETDETFISADLGRIDIPRKLKSEKSLSLNYAKYTSEKSKLGTSFLVGESESKRRSLAGIYGIFGVLSESILKFEVDYQSSYFSFAPNEEKNLVTGSMSFGYEMAKGLLPYIITEQLKSDLKDNLSQTSSYGVGIQWLPMPHIEIQAELKKQNVNSSVPQDSDSGWFVLHFYL